MLQYLNMELITGVNDHGRRLDRILRKALPDCPLPLIHKLLRKGAILVDGKPSSAQTRVEKGSKITLPNLSAQKLTRKALIRSIPRTSEPLLQTEDSINVKKNIKVRFFHPPDVVWQDMDLGLIAFNKPKGLAVHGQASLERMVQAYLANKLPHSISFKPGPLHRLDKPSSGIVIFSASLEGANLFTSLMKEQKIKKTYLAVTEGIMNKNQYWTDYLIRDKEKKKSFITNNEDKEKTGKLTVTEAKPLKSIEINGKPYTLIEAEIKTGRTHQIRAQSAFHGFPLAGDKKYGASFFKGGFHLHAWKMEFLDFKIKAPLPEEFKKLIDTAFGKLEPACG